MRVTRTYLELADPGRFVPAFREVPGFRVARVEEPGPALYRRLYRTVGEAYHWRDRWDWTDDQIRTHLADPAITLYVAEVNGALAGWYELKRISSDDSVEVAYFGLAPGSIGKGLGKHLLSCAVRDAWALAPSRVWLHTCTLDHPHALPNYKARGFVEYKKEEYDVE